VVVALAAPPSATVMPAPFAAGLMLPEMLISEFGCGLAGEVALFCFVERPWHPTIAIRISETVA
jgi:hypothetical protein